MNSREKIRSIIAGESTEVGGVWIGDPKPESWPALHEYFQTTGEEQLRQKLGDDLRWICPQFFPDVYRSPRGEKLFDSGVITEGKDLSNPLANCMDVKEVEDYPWPNADYLNFDSCIEVLTKAGEVYRASGFWTCFYHNLSDLFGMEEYLIKMYTHPKVVEAATDHICQFYYDANQKFFKAAGSLVDGFFFGNDLGTQLDLIISPAHFERFIMPWMKCFIEQGHRFGYQVILHSCGSIYKIIDRLIDVGVDCLHPIQAKADNMSADILASDFKGRISFMGGVDTQDLLVNGTAEEVKSEVRRIKGILSPGLVVSPSHEALLPNVPPENVEAMVTAALE